MERQEEKQKQMLVSFCFSSSPFDNFLCFLILCLKKVFFLRMFYYNQESKKSLGCFFFFIPTSGKNKENNLNFKIKEERTYIHFPFFSSFLCVKKRTIKITSSGKWNLTHF